MASDIDLPYEGAVDIAGSMNITFKADIAQLVDHRPSVLYWVTSPARTPAASAPAWCALGTSG